MFLFLKLIQYYTFFVRLAELASKRVHKGVFTYDLALSDVIFDKESLKSPE